MSRAPATTGTTGGMRYDAVVIGAGLNGLAAAAYLARQGARVLVLERRSAVGGAAARATLDGVGVPGPIHDAGFVSPALVTALQLDTHGLRLEPSTVRVVARGDDDVPLLFGAHGPDLNELRRLSPADASRWPAFADRVRALSGFLGELYAAPVPDVALAERGDVRTAIRLALRFRGLGKRDMVEVLRVLPMSIAEWLDDWFEHPTLKGMLATRGILHGSLGPMAAGTAFTFLHHHVGRAAGGIAPSLAPAGGAAAVVDALDAAARAAGAEIRTGTGVASMLMRDGAAAGVVTEAGDEIAARVVASAASPRHTFLELCDPAHLAPEFVAPLTRIRYRGAWAAVTFVLDAPARFGDAQGVAAAPSLMHLERAADAAKYGQMSDAPFVYAVAADAEGRVVHAHAQFAPYALRDGPWDDAQRATLGDRVAAAIEREAAGFGMSVQHRQVLAPPDLEREYGLPEGHAYHGELALDQALFMRPVPACSHYHTPIPDLYLCGAGAHPAGAVAGAAGLNAARVIARDLKQHLKQSQ